MNTQNSNSTRLITWYLIIRLIVVCIFLGGTIVYHLQQGPWSNAPVARYLVYLTLITGLQTFLSFYRLGKNTRQRSFINFQICWDLLFIILLIYITGGVLSLYSFFFILIIIAASVFLPRSQVLIVASAAAILYGSLLELQFFGFFPVFSGQGIPKDIHVYDVFYTVFLHVGAFFLTALLSGALTERVRRSEEAREKREIDYGELELLNQAILTNINSGLMVVNSSGRIRSFNKAASRITGYQLHQVYNRPIEAIFPEFDLYDPKIMAGVERGEMHYRKNLEEVLVLGYSISPIFDTNNSNLGLLFTFQDLTAVKALEDQVKRTDRLAAVGRLASGLAHEIRNPLASISGSVQLLLEDKKVKDEDRYLMSIVVKEADRLSALISNFLEFAKPSPLQVERVDMANLVDELVELISANSQFHGITLEKAYQGPVFFNVDPQKMHQVLWDLLLNAGEAVRPSGRIKVEIQDTQGQIHVEDSGPGVSEQDRDKLFEPFFTTKEKGTGLGLANAYANIQAHGGKIFIGSGSLGGARFTIDLPSHSTRNNP